MGTEERLSLDVAISTYRPEGIKRVEKMLSPLSPHEGVKYIVSWQEHANEPIPESLISRDDVEIHRFDIKGLSNNRNNAMDHCQGDIVLIADDDLEYHRDFAKKIIESFEGDPSLDLATFKIDYLNKKIYPDSTCVLECPFPKNYFVTSMEIAFKRNCFHDLKFYPELGLGSESMHCGEEEMFLVSAIRRKMVCRFVNKEIARHPQPTTGDRVSPEIIRAQGFVISLIYGIKGVVRIPLKAYRIKKQSNYSFIKSIVLLCKGCLKYNLNKNKIPKRYRW